MPSRILIVAFDKEISSDIKTYLGKRGHDVKVLNKAHNVIDVARWWLPNLIVVDSIIALQICRSLINNPRTMHIPIITLQEGNSLSRQYFLEVGVLDVVAKPFDTEELSLRIENWIRMVTQKALGCITKPFTDTDNFLKNKNYQTNLSVNILDTVSQY